jgi:predicted TIM-barrel fold metal-dependent hydrolase
MAVLLTKPNVYTDTSEQSWFLPVNAFAPVLRQFLEFAPEKVLFGTDLYGADEPIGSEGDGASIGEGWEEVGWITNRRVRDSLAIALSGMVRDGETTRERALEIARMVLNGNARKLYQLRSGR